MGDLPHRMRGLKREVHEACWIYSIPCASLHLFCFIGGDYGYMCISLKKVMKIDKVWWDKIIKNGIFAALFVTLLVYVIRTNDERENRYIHMIDTLNNTVNEKLVELKALHTGARS